MLRCSAVMVLQEFHRCPAICEGHPFDCMGDLSHLNTIFEEGMFCQEQTKNLVYQKPLVYYQQKTMIPSHVLCFTDRSDSLNLGVVPFFCTRRSALSPRNYPRSPKQMSPKSAFQSPFCSLARSRYSGTATFFLYFVSHSSLPTRTELEGRGPGP